MIIAHRFIKNGRPGQWWDGAPTKEEMDLAEQRGAIVQLAYDSDSLEAMLVNEVWAKRNVLVVMPDYQWGPPMLNIHASAHISDMADPRTTVIRNLQREIEVLKDDLKATKLWVEG